MLTVDVARELHRAAGTIEVGPGEPLPALTCRSRWHVPVAVAAVVVRVAVFAFGLAKDDDSRQAAVAPPTGEPVETPHVLDDGQPVRRWQ